MIRWFRSLLFLTFSMTAVALYAAVILLLFWAPRSWTWAVCVNYCKLALWAGAFFCGLFWLRGFAVSVYTHAIYDVIVMVILA